MGFLLDTNVLRPDLDKKTQEFLDSLDPSQACTSAIVIGETYQGIIKMDEGKRKRRLITYLNSCERRYVILPVCHTIAKKFYELKLLLEQEGKRIGPDHKPEDLLIASTAIVHNLKVITDNKKHFEPTGVALFIPREEL